MYIDSLLDVGPYCSARAEGPSASVQAAPTHEIIKVAVTFRIGDFEV